MLADRLAFDFGHNRSPPRQPGEVPVGKQSHYHTIKMTRTSREQTVKWCYRLREGAVQSRLRAQQEDGFLVQVGLHHRLLSGVSGISTDLLEKSTRRGSAAAPALT
jgi:hypothetical protein